MPAEPELPPEVRRVLEALNRDLAVVWDRIKAEEAQILAQWGQQTRLVRLQRLRDMQRNIQALVAEAEQVARLAVPSATRTAYELGAWSTALAAAQAGPTFTAVDLDAVNRLAQDTLSDVLAATRGVQESTKGFVREIARTHLLDSLYTGTTAEQAGTKLAADLAEKAIHAVTYADGRRVGLTSYTDMLMRTRTAEAFQQGGFTQGRALGITWWEIMDGPNCGLSYHDDPTLADGMIVPTDMAERYPISHPNCVRVTTPRPDIETPGQAKEAKRTSSEQQVADQAAASRARAAAYERQPRSRTLNRRLAREQERRAMVSQGLPVQSPAQLRNTKAVAKAQARAEIQDPLARFARIAPESPTVAATKTNPHKALSLDYQHNCSYVVNAVELRARGYDVIASPVSAAIGRSNREIARDWLTADGKIPEFVKIADLPSGSRTVRGATADWPVGARGFVSGDYKRGNSAHIMNLEKTADGLRIIEGQTAATTSGQAAETFRAFSPKSIQVLRTDNLVPNSRLARSVQAPGEGADAVIVAVERARVTKDLQYVTKRMDDMMDELREVSEAYTKARAAEERLTPGSPERLAARRVTEERLRERSWADAYYTHYDSTAKAYRKRLAELDARA